jgi:3-hydroxyacyl-CoA dehydrogenase
MIFIDNIKADKAKVVLSKPSASLIDIGDGVFCLEYHTKMNAINGEIVDFIPEVGDYVNKNGVGMVIGNQAPGIPGAFSAGGDLKYMGDLAAAKKFNEIEKFITNVHVGLKAMKYSGYPVVAAPYGMAHGGGCECCLWADKIVAHCELYMGLVEIGAGLLPAGGGCTNLWRRVSEAPIVATTDWLTAFLGAFQTIAMAKVGMSAMEARKAGFLRPIDRIVVNKDYLIGEAKKEVLRMVEDGYVAPAKTGIKVMGHSAMGAVDANLPDMLAGGMITPHMAHIARTIAYVLSGGEAIPGSEISEDAMLKLEIEAFVDLWKTENSQKMAEHMATKGKPLFL